MNEQDMTVYTDTGIIVFADGKTIAIEVREYSSDNKTNWERGDYNPFEHVNSLTGVGTLPGHVYTRIKHVGDSFFQTGYRLNPKEAIFRVTEDNVFEWKYLEESDIDSATQISNWKLLLDLNVFKGEEGDPGDQGIRGEGLHSDSVGYYKMRPDCGNSLLSTSSCTSCNPGSISDTTDGYYFVSIGDGLLTVSTAIQAAGSVTIDSIIYTHQSNDALVWTPLSSTVIDYDVRYLATDVNGTGAMDMRTKDYYGTRGHIYVCADNKWTDLGPVLASTFQVGERAGSNNIGFLNTFITDALLGLDDSITLEDGKLKVAVESIDETAFDIDTFGDGIDIEVAQDKPKVKVEDFSGYGIAAYESLVDGNYDQQVFVQDFISDGLTFENEVTIDGEQRDKMLVNVTDLINSPNTTNLIYTGLTNSITEGYIEEDGYPNIFVKPGDCIETNADGVNVKADELSLVADNLTEVKVKTYVAGNDGIMAPHLNPNVVNELKGLLVDNSTGIEIKPDSVNGSLGFNPTGELEIPENAIQGLHLNDNVADNGKGLFMNQSSGYLETRIDAVSIIYDDGKLAVDPSFIEDTMAGGSVTKIAYKGTDLYGDIALTTTTNDTYGMLDLNAVATRNAVGDDLLNLVLDFDEDIFENTVKALIDVDHIETKLENILIAGAGIDLAFDSFNDTVTITNTVTATDLVAPGDDIKDLNSLTIVNGISTEFAREDHKHSITNVGIFKVEESGQSTDRSLSTALDTKIELDVEYDDCMISKSGGMMLISEDGSKWSLSIDNQGNIDRTKQPS